MKETDVIISARITAKPRPIPEGMFDEMPKVMVSVAPGHEEELFWYYPDELTFTAEEFDGLTVAQGRDLFRQKDVRYLRS